MVEQQATDPLSAILKAAGDPTRRRILTLLAQNGPQGVTTLADHFDISLNAVSKHIKALEAAGLVSRRTRWRNHLIELQTAPLARVDHWFHDLRSIWEQRLDALEHVLATEDSHDRD